MTKPPAYAVDLVKELDKLYPKVSPQDSITDRELWGKIYQRRLVESLLVKYNIKESDIE